MVLLWVEAIILIVLFLFLVRTLISHILARRFVRAKTQAPAAPVSDLPPISIIKPVRGLDQGAEVNFLSYIRSDYSSPFEICFCVEERDDVAVPLIQRLIAAAQGMASRGAAIWTIVLCARLGSLAAVNLWFGGERSLWRYIWLAPILDFFKVALWLGSYLNPYIVWRGRKYRVMPDATIRPA